MLAKDTNLKTFEMPEVLGFKYLLDYLSDLDYGVSGINGLSSLPYTEIQAYSLATNTKLSHFEATTLKRLSVEYVVQIHKKDINEEPPYYTGDDFTIDTAISMSSILQKLHGVSTND